MNKRQSSKITVLTLICTECKREYERKYPRKQYRCLRKACNGAYLELKPFGCFNPEGSITDIEERS